MIMLLNVMCVMGLARIQRIDVTVIPHTTTQLAGTALNAVMFMVILEKVFQVICQSSIILGNAGSVKETGYYGAYGDCPTCTDGNVRTYHYCQHNLAYNHTVDAVPCEHKQTQVHTQYDYCPDHHIADTHYYCDHEGHYDGHPHD